MSQLSLDQALERCERALRRIERSVETRPGSNGRDDALRARVAAAVAELDDIIGQAGGPR